MTNLILPLVAVIIFGAGVVICRRYNMQISKIYYVAVTSGIVMVVVNDVHYPSDSLMISGWLLVLMPIAHFW